MKVLNNRVSIVCSCLFFMLFCWIVITLLSSRFLETFSYIFFIFIREYGVFSTITNRILLCGALLSLAFLVIGAKKFDAVLHSLIFCLCIGFIYFIVFTSIQHPKPMQDIASLLLIESSIDHRSVIESIWDYKARIFLSSFVYVFFVFLPLAFSLFHITPNTKSYAGNLLEILKPSLEIVVMALFASAIQPFYLKANFYEYIDLAVFVLGTIFLCVVLIQQRPKLDFYGYSNIVLLFLGIIVVALCSNILASSDQYFHVRYMLYAFVFVAWYAEWGYNYIMQS